MGLSEEDQKRIIKEALKEWMDEKFLAFGKWSALTIAAAVIAALSYFILWINHWSLGPK